jgi:RNA 2',3'-cyclic 3'-phosphodiesterase
MKRIFIAIEIPEEIKEEIIQIQKQLPEFKGKLTEIENLHVTLKFLGEIEEEKIEEIKKRLREIKFKGFESKIDKIGFFDNSDRGVIWIHVANCEELQKEVDNSLYGLFEKEKRFMSHLTIARTKEIKDKKIFLEELEKIKISPLGFSVKEFVLKESIPLEGKHIYKDLERYNLD